MTQFAPCQTAYGRGCTWARRRHITREEKIGKSVSKGKLGEGVRRAIVEH